MTGSQVSFSGRDSFRISPFLCRSAEGHSNKTYRSTGPQDTIVDGVRRPSQRDRTIQPDSVHHEDADKKRKKVIVLSKDCLLELISYNNRLLINVFDKFESAVGARVDQTAVLRSDDGAAPRVALQA